MSEVIDRRISFNGGELSPWTDPRLDLDKYRSSCRRLENMVPKVYGGAFGRPGTVFMGEAKYGDRRCRLIEFEYSVTTSLILELGDGYIRFWFTGNFPGRVFDPIIPANPYEIASPWDKDECFELQFAQQNDVVFITHPNHPVQVLTRLANNNWTLGDLPVEWPALFDENITATTIAASATTGSSVTLTASAPLFQPGHVGSTWVIKQRRTTPSVSLALNASAGTATAALFVLGDWSCTVAVNTGGTWEDTAVVQRSFDKVTWETIRSVSSSGVQSGTVSGTEFDPIWLRVLMQSTTGAPPASGSFNLVATDPDHYGIVRFNSVTNSTTALVTVVFELGDTAATKRWQEGAWSGYRGYPRSVALHQNRLMFGGSLARPQTIWGSVIDDYFPALNMRVYSDDDAGLSLQPTGLKANPIQWLVSQDSLLVGTSGSEGPMGSRDSDKALGPSTSKKGRFTNIGSTFLQALPVNDAVIFINRSGRKAWEFSFAFESDGYKAIDLTLLSEHITDGEIVQLVVQKNPDTIIWAPLKTGEIIGISYDRSQNVAGWFRYNTGVRTVGEDILKDSFESVALVSGVGEDDEQWASVHREIDGQDVRYIERFQPNLVKELKQDNQSNLVYSDAAGIYEGAATNTVTGADWLEGREVSILADGGPVPPQVVTNGSFTIPFNATKIVYGLPFVPYLEPTFLETNDPGSLSKVMKKLAKWADVELWKTLGMEISADGGLTFEKVEFRRPSDNMDQAPPLFTGMMDRQLLESSSNKQRTIIIRQTQPLPLNVLSIHTMYTLENT